MNILHILSKFDSYDAISQTLDLAKYLVDNGHNCTIASTLNIADIDNSKIQYLAFPDFETNVGNSFFVYKQLKETIRDNNIDVIHSHSALSNWISFLVSRHTDKPLVTSCYDFYTKNIFNSALFLGKKIIIHSQAIGNHLLNNFRLSQDRLYFIKQSLDLANFPFQDLDQRSKTDFKIGIISPLLPNKGHEYFLKSMVKVVRIIPFVKIKIADSMPQSRPNFKDEIVLWIRRLGLVSYVEFFDYSSLGNKVLSDFNILIVNPVVEDASNRIVLEAQAYGVPVIASCVAGIAEEIIDNKTGILVPPKDHNALANAIIKLLKDFQFTRGIIASARKRIEQESNIERNIGSFIDTYQQVNETKKILIINIGKIHNIITCTPAIRILKENNPQAKITSLILSCSQSLLNRCPYIDELMILDAPSKQKGIFGFVSIIKLLLQKKFDAVFDFTNNFKTHLLSYFSLANKRYGYKRVCLRFLINCGIKRPEKSEDLTKDYLDILKSAGFKMQDREAELWPSKEDMEFIESFLSDSWVGNARIIGVDISSKAITSMNSRLLDYWAYLCDQLSNQGMRVVLTGSNQDLENKDALFKRIASKPISAIGDISFIQLACLIKKCDAYISSNPESLHIAIAMKVPSLLLSVQDKIFNPDSFRNIGIISKDDFPQEVLKRSKKRIFKKYSSQDFAIKKINDLINKK